MMISWQRHFYILAFLLALTVGQQVGWSQGSAGNKPLVLKGATLIDGTGKPAVPDAVILIEGDRIAAVGGRQTNYPPDATVVDLTGNFVIPGLVDSHVHYRPWLGELFLNHGVTTVFAMQPRDTYGEAYYQLSQRPDVRTPRLYDNGANLALSPSMTREQVREQIQNWLKREPEFAKMPPYNERIKQPYQWMAEEIHAAGLLTYGHAEDCRAAVEAGLNVVEHVWGCAKFLMSREELESFERGESLHWGLFLKDKARRDQLIQQVIQRGGNFLNPTFVYEFGSQSTMASQFEADIDAIFRNSTVMAYYPANLADGLRIKFQLARNYSKKFGTMVHLSHLNDRELQQSKEAYRLTGEFTKRWIELGGKVIGGSDSPSIGTAGLSLHMEMAMLVESGLTPMQALQAAGVWGAELLTAKRKKTPRHMVGSVTEGAFADLVVLSANPLDAIGNTRKIERVMKGGKFVKLGYSPDYASAPAGIITATPYILAPEISAITPSRVVAGNPEFELVVDGEGFLPNSVVQADGAAVPTAFVDIRTLKARMPASIVAQPIPNRFVLYTNPEQRVDVYGDRTVKITVFTGPPDGGLSNSVSLKVIAK